MSMKLANEIKISLVTVVCILALTVISKNILHVQMDFISQYAPIWMFVVYIITRERKQRHQKFVADLCFGQQQ